MPKRKDNLNNNKSSKRKNFFTNTEREPYNFRKTTQLIASNTYIEKYIETLLKCRIDESVNEKKFKFEILIFVLYDEQTIDKAYITSKITNSLLLQSQFDSLIFNKKQETYIKEFQQDTFDKLLLSIKIKPITTPKSDFIITKEIFNFIFIPICKQKFLPFELKFEKTNLIVGKIWILPNIEFHGLWEALEFDTNIKNELLDYCSAAYMFTNCKVDSRIISYNRIILLNGPPGTGKTSLAKALSQQLSIKWIGLYKCYKLIDINSHFLLSEYFSDSSKQIVKVFHKIKEFTLENPDIFHIMVIDEIETLLSSRESTFFNNEPQDSLRAVNSILTQLDQIKQLKNILIITTSNLLFALDNAFLDRVDVKYYIKEPSLNGIYKIYETCIIELINKSLLVNEEDDDFYHTNQKCLVFKSLEFQKLFQIACNESQQISGRMLRKLPFLAYKNMNSNLIEEFLFMLIMEIRKYKIECNIMAKKKT